MDVAGEKQALLDQVRAGADSDYLNGVRRVLPGETEIIGARVPDLRMIAEDWQRSHAKIDSETLLDLVEALWEGQTREECLLALFLLERYQRVIPLIEWERFDRWRQDLNNWELTDHLAQKIFGEWVLSDSESRLDHLRELIEAPDVWSRRMALVATTWLNRGRTDVSFPDVTLQLVNRVRDDRHPMITKSVSWALRELSKRYPEQVWCYVNENRDALASDVIREVVRKIKTSREE
ncbi:MAG: DNA alkylation repair protein [Anaerolineales bacterium]